VIRPRWKLPVSARALFAGGLLLGAALVPVAAQQVGQTDGQVAVRSDGAVYLLTNGQRRWVATVQITDDELNAYPEGEPLYGGLAPMGSSSTASAPRPAAAPAASPSTAVSSNPSSSTTTSTTSNSSSQSSPAGTTAAAGPTEVSTPTGATGQVDPQVPIEVDINGVPKVEPGERLILDLKTKTGASCELAVKWPDGTEVDQAKMTADSRGRCHYSIEVPASEAVGTGSLKGIARVGDRMSRQDVEFEVIAKN
jgi:hypothetical protein